MKTVLVTALVSLLAAVIFQKNSTAQEDSNMIRNGGFEHDTDGDGMADHWQFSGDSGVTATWSLDDGFIGKFSQRLNCTHFTSLSPASHAMLCQMDTVHLEKGRWYRISFAAKQEGISGRTVQVAISNTRVWGNCGLQESFRVRPEWKQFEFVFQATQTISERVRLQFWYNSTGSFWLDDVRLEPSEPPARGFTEVLPPTDAVNLIPNSSFECGASGWGSIADLPGWGGNLNELVGSVDNTSEETQPGSSSFMIALTQDTLPVYYFDYFSLYRIPVKAPLVANQGWITVKPGTDYTLSAYMKSDSDGLVGVLSVRQSFQRNLRREIRLTTGWERYAFTFQPESEQVFVALGLDLEASKQDAGTVWIDRVQMEKGNAATPYQPRARVEVGLETDRTGNLYLCDTEPEMTAAIFNADDVPRSVVLSWQTTDFDDVTIHEDSLQVSVPPGQTVKLPVRPDVQKKGFYRLHLRCDGAELTFVRSSRFAVVDPYNRSDSLFGMNHAYPWSHLLDLSKQIGMCWFRDWSLKWHDVEKEKGEFDFTEADHQINRVLERGLNVLLLLPFPSSNWSSSAGSEVEATERYPGSRERIAYMPRDLDEFAAYVRAAVEYYRERLHIWEILNEPVYTDYALPRSKDYKVTDYVRLLQVAYQAVKEVDPDALVIGGIAGGTETYTMEFIEANGLRWVDALNLHTYPGLRTPESYEDGLRQLRERMRSAGADKPIWFTEGAYYADDDMPFKPHSSTWLKPLDSEKEAAEWQVKFNTILLAYGVRKIIYHSGTPGSLNNESLSGIFFEWAGVPRKMACAQLAMANLLPASSISYGRLDAPENIRAYGFRTGEQTVIVAWAEEYSEVEISLAGKTWRAVDLQGNDLDTGSLVLTERPVYFVGSKTIPGEAPW